MEASEVFVGRDDALALLRDAWTDAAAAHPRIVCVLGAAGVGKTSLTRHFVAGFAADRVRWVSVDDTYPQSQRTLVSDLVRTLAPESADEHLSTADVARVGASALRALATPTQPYVLVIDDLQWADVASQHALRFALRRLEAEPVLIILTIRAVTAASLDEPLRRMAGDPGVAVCNLDGLTVPEIVDLAGRMGADGVDMTMAERLRAHTDGLPLHTIALLAERGGEGLARVGRVLPAPRSLAAIVADRMNALTPATRDFLTAGAVLGSSFTVAAAAGMAGIRESTTMLREANGAGLTTADDARTVVFRHPLVRAAVYGALPAAQRRGLHRAAARMTGGVDALMHRVDGTDGTDDELSAELAAASEATSGVAQADLLLAAADCTSAPGRRDALTVAAAAALLEHGFTARAQTLRARVEDTAASASRDSVLALLDIEDGHFAIARDRCDGALRMAGGDVAGTGGAGTDGAGINGAGNDPGGVPSAGDLSAHDLSARDAPVAHLYAARALARWADGDFAGAFEDANRALRGDIGAATARCCYVRIVSLEVLGRLDELPTDPLPSTLGATDRLALDGITRFHRNDISGAIASLGEAVQRSRQGNPTSLFIIVLSILSEALYLEGQWDKAAMHAELAVSLAHDTDAYGELLLSHAAAAEIQSARGRFEASAEHLESVRAFSSAMPTWPTITRLGMTQALVAIAEDDQGMLLDAERLLHAEPGYTIVGRRPSVPWRILIAEAQLQAGRLAEASRTIDELTAITHGTQRTRALPDIARLTGWLAEAEGRDDDALVAYTISKTAAAAAHSPLAVARLRFARGLLQVRLGDAVAGRATLLRARAAFAMLGAAPFLRRCEKAMDTADEASLAAKPMLSPRQEAVALLVAEGLTNREIARRLYVSVKAVEYHLGQIYARTGLSRQGLGARMRGLPTWTAGQSALP